MHGISRQLITKQGIRHVCRSAADDVAGINVLQVHRLADLAEVLSNLASEMGTNVAQSSIAGSVCSRAGFFSQQVLSRSFCHDDYRMTPHTQPLFDQLKQSARAFQMKRDFGDQAEVYFLTS